MPNSISVNPAAITERQHLSARQLTSLHTQANLSVGGGSLEDIANSPAYILDLSDQAINQAANQLQSAAINQDSLDLANSPAYIVDISSESLRMAKKQQAQPEDAKAPKILKSIM